MPYEERRQRLADAILVEMILKSVMSDEDVEHRPVQQKRNSGMLDAVIQIPDLYSQGRK